MSDGTGTPIGAILAGGLGRRIGGAKAVVQLCGRPLIDYPLAAMRAVLPDVIVVAKADTKLPSLPGVTLWVESDPRRHPLIGILEALSVAGPRGAVVCAADLPFVTADVIARLAAEPDGVPATVARCQGVIQPLLARYGPTSVPRLTSALDVDDARLLDLVEAIGARYLELEDPTLLFNVNAPDDLLQAAAMLDARGEAYPNVKS